MTESNEEINIDDLRAMIEEQLERIERGEVIEIDPEVQEMVRVAVKNLSGDVIQEYESQSLAQLNGHHSQSEESESQTEGEPNNRRIFG